jgi:hypothetical protein
VEWAEVALLFAAGGVYISQLGNPDLRAGFYQGRGMTNNKTKKAATPRAPATPSMSDQARDELFSHILRCGVIEADAEQQKAWMDDTMQYLSERYSELTEEQLTQVRLLGDRFCKPVRRQTVEAAS